MDMVNQTGPLAGIRAVACSTAQAGTVPYMLMADLGADVIKIEPPNGGDGSRKAGELLGENEEISSFFETNNRGVRSLTLNLKTDEGRAILYKLVEQADVFGQNFRPSAAERNGFDYETLRKINPRLVYASVSGYGQLGPQADLPGTDAVGQALSGIAEAYSAPGQPMRTGVVSVSDEACAILTFGGLLAALIHARTTGVGQKVETSLVGSAVRLMGWTLTTTMWRNKNPITGARINGTRERPGIAASFNDADGKPLVFQLGHRDWKQAMDVLGFWDTLEERGASDLGLALESEEKKTLILGTLADLFATGKRDRWVELLRGADIVSAPVNTLLEASNDPNVLGNGYVQEVEYPELGRSLKVHGSPWQFSETPPVLGRAPALGQHNAEILESLGYSAAEIAGFVERKVI
jgi:crotonobetainyl-CoA:carnitine CoA-transferase CaiB-like acyl-CoA transferase